jgi:DNA primase
MPLANYSRCPFHKDDRPSFWVDDEAGLWGCYSAGCPVNAQGVAAHDVINLRMWAHGISIQAAIRQLATEFLPPLLPAPRKPSSRKK